MGVACSLNIFALRHRRCCCLGDPAGAASVISSVASSVMSPVPSTLSLSCTTDCSFFSCSCSAGGSGTRPRPICTDGTMVTSTGNNETVSASCSEHPSVSQGTSLFLSSDIRQLLFQINDIHIS
eukprot:XP_001708127.1 Hypothetical protein GL50803_20496 [Giardia lamblia ATCC 50803]